LLVFFFCFSFGEQRWNGKEAYLLPFKGGAGVFVAISVQTAAHDYALLFEGERRNQISIEELVESVRLHIAKSKTRSFKRS
jgi:hypothetical protein